MPHCILEYSGNVLDEPDFARLLLDVHEVLTETGLFALNDIKSRAVRHDHFVVADGASDRAFVTLNIQILEGRSDDVKAQISEAALDVLAKAFPITLRQRRCSLTVQVSELHRPSYRRRITSGEE